MRVLRCSAILAAAAVLAGCGSSGPSAYDKYRLGPAREAVAACVESTGGLSAWNKAHRVRADALVTIHGEDGQKYVNRQECVIDMGGRWITATAATGRQRWKATYTSAGQKLRLTNAEALDVMTPERLAETLAVLLHRVSGPLNLLGRDERVADVSDSAIAGRDYARVGVSGGAAGVVAYYFDAADASLAMVSAGSEEPGKDGTVTLYTYQKLPDGLVFPVGIRVVQTGQAVMVGRKVLMEVELSRIRID